jgi:tetratricopeptide (TPR) repeat protein
MMTRRHILGKVLLILGVYLGLVWLLSLSAFGDFLRILSAVPLLGAALSWAQGLDSNAIQFIAFVLVGTSLLHTVLQGSSGMGVEIRRAWRAAPGSLRRLAWILLIALLAQDLAALLALASDALGASAGWGDFFRRFSIAQLGVSMYHIHLGVFLLFTAMLLFGQSRRPEWERFVKGQAAVGGATLRSTADSTQINLSRQQFALLGKAERLLERGKVLQAARIFEKLGEAYFYRAGKLYEKALRPAQAQQAYLLAAKHFTQVGNDKRAGDAFFFAAQWDQATAFYRRALRAPQSLGSERKKEVVARLAESLQRQGQLQEAGALLLENQLFAEAGKCFQEAGLSERAAQAFAQGGLREASARAFEQSGRTDLADLQRARSRLDAGDFQAAARAFESGADWGSAAETWIKALNPAEAARCLLQAGRHAEAAEQYLAAGKQEEALAAYVAGSHYGRAAQLAAHLGLQDAQAEYYEKAGRHLAAGRSYLMIGDLPAATRCFHRLTLQESEEIQSAGQILNILSQQGRFKEANACGEQMIQDVSPSILNCSVFFALAQIKEKLGSTAQAAELYIQAAIAFPSSANYAAKARQFSELTGIPYQPRQVDALDGAASEAKAESKAEAKAESRAAQVVPAPPRERATSPASSRSAPKITPEYNDTLTLDEDLVLDLTQDGELQRYEMIQEIGRGGMGIVYKARDKKLDRLVAFKMLHPEYNRDPKVVLFFKREAQAVASLNQPNIVTLYDVGYKQGCFYMVMEFVEGMTMEKLLKKYEAYLRQNLLGLLYETCLGLKYAHEKGILHRDLKPSNLMVTKDGRVKIMDFGLAKKLSDPNHTQQVWGTPAFMAPELIQGEKATVQADIYSLGATFYMLATGVPPFNASEATQKFVAPGLPLAAHERVPGLMVEFSETLQKCLYLSRADRYQNIAELIISVKLLGQTRKKLYDSRAS